VIESGEISVIPTSAQLRNDGRPHPGVETAAVRQQQGPSVATQIVQGGVLAVAIPKLQDVHNR